MAPPALPAFHVRPFQRLLETTVVGAGVEDGTAWVELEDTILYPEGGGQPSDTGRINGATVHNVSRREDRIFHWLGSPVAHGPATVELDWERRWDHMQQHTAQHLLTALSQDRFGWATTAFHLGPRVSDVELDVPGLATAEIRALEDQLAAEIRAARPVRSRWVDPAELPTLQVRTRGLPEGFNGPVRLVEIEGLDLNTCGGTHLESTAQIESIALLGTEAMRGGTRLFFVAGARLRHRMSEHEERNGRLRTLLGTPDEVLADAVLLKLDQLKEANRRVRKLAEALAEERARRLAAETDQVVHLHDPDATPQSLQLTARRLIALAPAVTALLTAGAGEEGHFLLAAGPSSSCDLEAAGPTLATILEARGGGRPPFYQGKTLRLSKRKEALEALRALLTE